MKTLKLMLMAFVFPFLFSGCNKEDYFGNFQDLNGNGTLDQIQGRYSSKRYSLYFFDNGNFDTNYIVRSLKSRPILPHALDINSNNFPNVYYWVSKGSKSQKFIVKNNEGVFEEPEELK